MGMHHVLSVSADALELNKDRQPDMEAAIGEAVFSLCAAPQFGHLGGPKLERVVTADVLNFGGAIRRAGEFHHTEFAVLVWSRGQFKELAELSSEEKLELSRVMREATGQA